MAECRVPADAELGVPLEVIKERIIEYFRQLREPLFAILDAARDPLVLANRCSPS